MYASMNGAGFYRSGNHAPISARSFLIDNSVAKEQIYAPLVVRSMSITSNQGAELQSPVLFLLRRKIFSWLQVRAW